MTVVAKLAGFAVVLALAFGTAALAGSRLDVRPGEEKGDTSAMRDEHAGGAPQPVRGLAVSDKGLTLELARRTAPRGERFELAFRVVDPRGRTVRAFDLEHTKRMHLIVVRRDMTGFEHLHPTQQPDGSWSATVTLAEAGAYRVFADFSVDGTPHTLAGDLAVDGAVRFQELPPPSGAATVDGLRVSLNEDVVRAGQEAEIGFTVTRDGRPVALREHLGAKGHLVALREGDLAFLHVHPDERSLRFETTFPTAGRHRLFLQLKTADGRIHTAAFTLQVTR